MYFYSAKRIKIELMERLKTYVFPMIWGNSPQNGGANHCKH